MDDTDTRRYLSCKFVLWQLIAVDCSFVPGGCKFGLRFPVFVGIICSFRGTTHVLCTRSDLWCMDSLPLSCYRSWKVIFIQVLVKPGIQSIVRWWGHDGAERMISRELERMHAHTIHVSCARGRGRHPSVYIVVINALVHALPRGTLHYHVWLSVQPRS